MTELRIQAIIAQTKAKTGAPLLAFRRQFGTATAATFNFRDWAKVDCNFSIKILILYNRVHNRFFKLITVLVKYQSQKTTNLKHLLF